ncbi:MAG: hypothetical protein QXF76_03630 [Candidatus Anstonellales archaeon]
MTFKEDLKKVKKPLNEDLVHGNLSRNVPIDGQLSVFRNSLANLHSYLIITEIEGIGHIHRYHIAEKEMQKLQGIRDSILRLIRSLISNGYSEFVKEELQKQCGAVAEFLNRGKITYSRIDFVYYKLEQFFSATTKYQKKLFATEFKSEISSMSKDELNKLRILLENIDEKALKELSDYLRD